MSTEGRSSNPRRVGRNVEAAGRGSLWLTNDWQLLELMKRSRKREIWRAYGHRHRQAAAVQISLNALDATRSHAEDFFEAGFTALWIDHPNVPRPLSMGVAGVYPYLAFHYVSGQPLDVVIERWRRQAPEATWLERRKTAHLLASLVLAVHARRVFHRDIKPGNTLLDEACEVHLVDWSLAHAPTLRPASGLRAGATAAYASPEQAERRPHSGEADDAFALGMTLAEILTLRPVDEIRGMERGALDSYLSGRTGVARAIEDLTERDPEKRVKGLPLVCERITP